MLASETLTSYEEVLANLSTTYKKKNQDYGDSFHKSVTEFGPLAGLVRIGDKYNRLKQLITTGNQQVKDESIKDTLLDMANYCIMLSLEL